MSLRTGRGPRAGRCTTAAAAAAVALTVAAVAAVAAAAAVAPVAGGGDGAAVATPAGGAGAAAAAAAAVVSATVRGELASVGRPLVDGVSILTDGLYALVDAAETRFGCPPSVTIAGPLAITSGSFTIAPASLTVNGTGCTGTTNSSVVAGLTGDALFAAANATGATSPITALQTLDAAAAVAGVRDGPITCGPGVAFVDASWTFLVVADVPLLVLIDGDDPTVGCTLLHRPPSQAPASIRVGGGVARRAQGMGRWRT